MISPERFLSHFHKIFLQVKQEMNLILSNVFPRQLTETLRNVGFCGECASPVRTKTAVLFLTTFSKNCLWSALKLKDKTCAVRYQVASLLRSVSFIFQIWANLRVYSRAFVKNGKAKIISQQMRGRSLLFIAAVTFFTRRFSVRAESCHKAVCGCFSLERPEAWAPHTYSLSYESDRSYFSPKWIMNRCYGLSLSLSGNEMAEPTHCDHGVYPVVSRSQRAICKI